MDYVESATSFIGDMEANLRLKPFTNSDPAV